MKRSAWIVCVVGFLFVIWANLAYADAIVVDIQFPFKAGGKDFASGKYRIEADPQTDQILIRNTDTGKGEFLPCVTRLAGKDVGAEVVFDRQGDQYFLSELYIPGIDGFELKGAAGKHTHVKVKAGKS